MYGSCILLDSCITLTITTSSDLQHAARGTTQNTEIQTVVFLQCISLHLLSGLILHGFKADKADAIVYGELEESSASVILDAMRLGLV